MEIAYQKFAVPTAALSRFRDGIYGRNLGHMEGGQGLAGLEHIIDRQQKPALDTPQLRRQTVKISPFEQGFGSRYYVWITFA